MSEQTASNDEDPSQSIPSDPSSTPGCDDTEPQDDQVSEKSLSSLEDYRSNSQESRIGTPTLEAITAINALSNGYSDGVSDTEDEYEYDDEGENEDQAGDGGDDTHGGPSSQQSFEIWSDGTYDSDRTGNGTDHEGNDQDDYQDGGQEQKDNDDDEREDKEYDEDEEDEEEHTTLIDSPRSEIGSQLPTPPPPSPNQPPSIASQQLPQYDTNPQSYLGPPPDQQPEQQDYELPPTHGLPQVHGLGRMGDPFLSNPLQDNQAYYGAGSDALYYPYPGQGQYDIRRDSEGNPVCSPLPPPAIPLPPLPAGESFLGHGPTRQYQDQCQYQYRYQYEDQYENQYQDQHQDQNHDPNGLPQLDESRHSASTEYENGVPVGGGSGREAYPGLVLQSTEGPNDQHGVGGTRSNPISLSSGDNGEPARRGSHPETAITISTGSSDNGSRPETAIAASSGSSDSGDSGPAPGGGTSGQGHDGEDDRTPEGSATGQEQYEGSDPAPASDQNASDAASTGSSQNEREHVSLWAQVSPVYGTSLSGTDGETLDESVTQGYYYMDSDSEEQQEQEQTRPYGPTSPTLSPSPERQPAGQDETGSSYPEPTYTGYPVIPGVAEHYNPYLNSIYPYSPTQPTLPNTGQDFGPDLEPNTQEYYGYFPEGYYEQHNEEPQQPSEHTPEEQALYENLTDQNRLNAPIALARDIVDVMRDMINSSSNSRHSSPRYSPVVTPSQDRSAPAIPVPISFSTHYHRFFEAETGSAPASFTGPPRTYTYVPALSEFPGVAERSVPSVSEGEDEAEVGPPPPPLHTPVSVPTIIEPRRLSTPEIDTGFETERLPSTPTPIPRPVLLRSLGICESPARLSRSPTPVSPRTINIGPRQVPEVPEERESAPELKAESEPEPEPEPKLKSESLSDTEPGQNETPQTNRESESVQVKPESEADTALETIPEYESAPESQPSTRAPSDAGSEYKPGPEADTDSDSEAELGNNQQLVADELGDGVHEQTQEQKQELEKGSGENSKNGSDETEYHSSRESAPSPSPYQTPPPRNPSPPPRRITRAYARQLQQGQQTSTKTSEQAEQGPSKTKEGKGKRKARELTPSPPRGTKRKESSSPSPPPSPPKRRATRSQTLQQEPKKADSGSGKGKRKAKATTSKGTKRRAESPSPPENQGPVSKKRRVTEAETEEAYPEQPALRLRSNPRVATRADQRERCTYPDFLQTYTPPPVTSMVVSNHTNIHAKVSPLIVNNPPTAIRSVYVFGANSHGQLGLGHAEANVTQPTLNTNLTKDTVGVVDLAAGGHHCVALTHDNRILTWGDNSDGQLGRETQAQQEPTPMEVDFTELGLPADTVFVQVTATESATFVLTEFGDVYGWGTFRVCLPTLQNII